MNTDDHYEEAMILMLTLDGSEFSFKTTNQNTEIIVLNEDQLTYAPPAMVEVINAKRRTFSLITSLVPFFRKANHELCEKMKDTAWEIMTILKILTRHANRSELGQRGLHRIYVIPNCIPVPIKVKERTMEDNLSILSDLLYKHNEITEDGRGFISYYDDMNQIKDMLLNNNDAASLEALQQHPIHTTYWGVDIHFSPKGKAVTHPGLMKEETEAQERPQLHFVHQPETQEMVNLSYTTPPPRQPPHPRVTPQKQQQRYEAMDIEKALFDSSDDDSEVNM